MTRIVSLVCLVAVAAALGACGSSSKSNGGTSTIATPAKSSTAWAQSFLAKAYAGTDGSLPSSSPPAAKDKTVWILSCSQSAPGCAVPAQAAAQAAQAIGWKSKVLDGKFNPTVWNTLVRSAAASKPDALILDAVDCAAVQASLNAAKQAGVKVYGFYSFDCNDTYTKDKPEFDAQLAWNPWKNYADFVENQFAKTQAAYAIAKTGANAKVVQLCEVDVAVAHHLCDGYDRWIKTCSGCQVYKVPFTGADLIGGKLQAKTAAALTKYPNANVVSAPYDATILLGIGPAVAAARAAGRKVMLTGGEGLAPNIALMKKGVENFAAGLPAAWVGWATIDGVNRMFQGQPQVGEGLGNGAIDATHNLPTKTPYYDGNQRSQD
ncbi:MAG TPA: substrate-binding domain-containing protein, partial [Solirubrobacteraceae bacterium]